MKLSCLSQLVFNLANCAGGTLNYLMQCSLHDLSTHDLKQIPEGDYRILNSAFSE